MELSFTRNSILKAGGYAVLAVLLYGLKVLYFQKFGLPDYDSVTNFQVANELVAGNFKNFARHASPTYNFFLAAQFIFFDYLTAEYVNCALFLFAIFLFNRFVSRQLNLKVAEELGLFALMGSPVTLTFLGRALTVDGLSLLNYVLVLKYFYEAIQQARAKKLYLAAFLFGLMLTIDYKAFLLLPIIFLLLVYQQQLKLTWKQLLICGGWLTLAPASYALIGPLLGLPWYHYFAVAYIFPFKTDDHPNRDVGFFNADLFYYLKYLFTFENPFLLPGILLAPFALKLKKIAKDRILTIGVFLTFFAFCLLGGMSLVQKAPRGILYAYLLFYVISFISLKRFAKNKYAFWGILAVAFGLNLYNVQRYIYPYSQTNYNQIADYLKDQQAKKIAVTVSKRINPFLPPEIAVKQLMENKQLENLKAQGIEYLLVDDYYKLTGIDFNLQPYQNVVLALPEPTLLSPILGLEHSEFAGFSFKESLQINRELKQQKIHLRLIKL